MKAGSRGVVSGEDIWHAYRSRTKFSVRLPAGAGVVRTGGTIFLKDRDCLVVVVGCVMCGMYGEMLVNV